MQRKTIRPDLDVVIRTLADKQRETALFRAINSIFSIATVQARPIIVANGMKYDATLIEALKTRNDVRFAYSEVPSAGRAMTLGRELVEAPYFMYLDDDDELLPDAMGRILKREIPAHGVPPEWDVLITNRLRDIRGSLARENLKLGEATNAPVQVLLQENWLSPGSAVFAARTIEDRVIDVGRDHHEWTHFAFRLASRGYRLKFIDEPTAVYRDSDNSLSKLDAHQIQEIDMLKALRAEAREQGRPDLERIVEVKYRHALHSMANKYSRKRQFATAWRYHIKSLKPPYTLKYLAFSRKLVWPF